MKKFGNKFGVLGWLLLISVIALGAKIGENILRIGDGSASDIEIQMGNGRLKWDEVLQKLLFSNDAGVSEQEIGSGGGGAAGINILENGDFEVGSPPTEWTASAGVFIAETVAQGFDAQSGSWDAAAGSDTLDSDFQAVPLGLENRKCNATMEYIYDTGSTGDYKLQVIANSAGLLVEKDLAENTDWEKEAVQFDCPASDSIKVRIISTLDGGIILLDQVTLGQSDFVDISQTLLVAHANYAPTASCAWARSNTALGDFTADTDCPAITVNFSTFAVSTGDNDLPDIDFADLPAGTYMVRVETVLQGAITAAELAIRLSDGTINGSLCSLTQDTTTNNEVHNLSCSHVFTYAASGPRNFKMQGSATSGAVSIINDVGGNGRGTLKFTVWKTPESRAQAITLETSGGEFRARHNNNCLWSDSNAAYDTPTGDATCDFAVEKTLGGILSVASVSDGNNQPGIVLTVNRAMTVNVCVQGGTNKTGSDGNIYDVRLFVVEDSLSLGEFHTRPGAVVDRRSAIVLCGDVTFSGPGSKDIVVQLQTTSQTVQIENVNDFTLTWQGHIVSQGAAPPIFTELQSLVRNLSGSGMRLLTADILCQASPVINQESGGDWISGITRTGTGRCTIDINANVCTTDPICNMNGRGISPGIIAQIDNALTLSSIAFPFKIFTDAGAATDGRIVFNCTCLP